MKKEKSHISDEDKKVILNFVKKIIRNTLVALFIFWGLFLYNEDSYTVAETITTLPINERYELLIFLIPIFAIMFISVELGIYVLEKEKKEKETKKKKK